MTGSRGAPIIEDMLAPRPLRVVIAGGGFAAGEALLALRALTADRVELALVAPDRRLRFRPHATTAAFGAGDVATFGLDELAADVGATFHQDAIRAVAPAARRISLTSGGRLDYDALVLAVGARARVGVPGALTFRDHRDVPVVTSVVDQLDAGAIRRLALTAPAGIAWTLPLYELALQAAADIDERGLAAEVVVVTPERAPLEVFGRAGSEAVAELLRDRGVRVLTRTAPRVADREGLHLAWGGRVDADRTIAVPLLSGRRLSGLPGDFSGFVPIDGRSRVVGLERVWAAGDMTTWPIKQGGLAAQQAELAAGDIAALAGVPDLAVPSPPVLRAQLVGGERPLYLRAELRGDGRPIDETAVVSSESPWWPNVKVFGRHLSPWLAEHMLETTPLAA